MTSSLRLSVFLTGTLAASLPAAGLCEQTPAIVTCQQELTRVEPGVHIDDRAACEAALAMAYTQHINEMTRWIDEYLNRLKKTRDGLDNLDESARKLKSK